MSKPKKFEDLNVAELRRSAVEDFAVAAGPDDNKKAVIAALAEAGVGWKDYVAQHPEVKPDEPVEVTEMVQRTPEPSRAGDVITATSMQAPEPETPVVASPVAASGNKPWLIKMTRPNVRFDVRGYTFTQEHPYALVQPEDVPHILEREEGFRQAYPTELQEFYGR